MVEPYFMNANHQLYLPIQTLCEAVWIMKKKLKIPNAHIVQVLEGILSQPNIIFDNDVVDFAMAFLKENGDFADGVIAYQATLSSRSLLTFDKKLQNLCQKFDIHHIAL